MILQLTSGNHIDVPLHPCERTFKRFTEFKEKERAYFEANKMPVEKESTDVALDDSVWLTSLIDMVETVVYDVDEAGVLLNEIPVSLESDKDIEQMIDEGFTIRIGDPISLVRLYVHFISMVNNYIPDEVIGDHIIISDDDSAIFRREKYLSETLCPDPDADPALQELRQKHCLYIGRDRAVSLLTGEGTTTGQVLEILEFQRRFSILMEAVKEGSAALDFELGLREMAILLLPHGKELPYKTGARRRFLQTQMKRMEDIPLDQILRVRFFLIGSLEDYIRTKITQDSSIHPKNLPGRTIVEAMKHKDVRRN